jgi:hypothetical protein
VGSSHPNVGAVVASFSAVQLSSFAQIEPPNCLNGANNPLDGESQAKISPPDFGSDSAF